MKFSLPVKVVSVANLREHWAKRAQRAKRHRETAKILTPTSIRLPCTITMVRTSPKMMDSDNIASAFKAVRDGIADKMGVNDNDARIEWKYEQRKGKYNVEVEVTWAI